MQICMRVWSITQHIPKMLQRDKWLASHPEEIAASTNLMGGLVGPRSRPDTEEDNLLPFHEIELQFLTRAAHIQVAIISELSWLP
jgi:hypothetical protein